MKHLFLVLGLLFGAALCAHAQSTPNVYNEIVDIGIGTCGSSINLPCTDTNNSKAWRGNGKPQDPSCAVSPVLTTGTYAGSKVMMCITVLWVTFWQIQVDTNGQPTGTVTPIGVTGTGTPSYTGNWLVKHCAGVGTSLNIAENSITYSMLPTGGAFVLGIGSGIYNKGANQAVQAAGLCVSETPDGTGLWNSVQVCDHGNTTGSTCPTYDVNGDITCRAWTDANGIYLGCLNYPNIQTPGLANIIWGWGKTKSATLNSTSYGGTNCTNVPPSSGGTSYPNGVGCMPYPDWTWGIGFANGGCSWNPGGTNKRAYCSPSYAQIGVNDINPTKASNAPNLSFGVFDVQYLTGAPNSTQRPPYITFNQITWTSPSRATFNKVTVHDTSGLHIINASGTPCPPTTTQPNGVFFNTGNQGTPGYVYTSSQGDSTLFLGEFTGCQGTTTNGFFLYKITNADTASPTMTYLATIGSGTVGSADDYTQISSATDNFGNGIFKVDGTNSSNRFLSPALFYYTAGTGSLNGPFYVGSPEGSKSMVLASDIFSYTLTMTPATVTNLTQVGVILPISASATFTLEDQNSSPMNCTLAGSASPTVTTGLSGQVVHPTSATQAWTCPLAGGQTGVKIVVSGGSGTGTAYVQEVVGAVRNATQNNQPNGNWSSLVLDRDNQYILYASQYASTQNQRWAWANDVVTFGLHVPCFGSAPSCVKSGAGITQTATLTFPSVGSSPQTASITNVNYIDGSSNTANAGETVKWASDNTSVATVNSSGVVSTAVSSGTANITATVNGVAATTPTAVTVLGVPTLSSCSLSNNTSIVLIPFKGRMQINSSCTYSDSSQDSCGTQSAGWSDGTPSCGTTAAQPALSVTLAPAQ